MKNFGTIIDEIKANKKIIADLDEFVKSAKWSERNEKRIVDAAEQAILLRVKNAILYDNARQAYYSDVLPVVLEELYKYAGKGFGEKTQEKTRNAVKARANCSFYIEHSYADVLHLVPLNDKGFSNTIFKYNAFEIYTRSVDGKRAAILNNNKIVPVPAENFYLSNCSEYTEDVDKRAREILDAFNAAKKAHDEFEKACGAFNRVKPSSIDSIYGNNYRNYLLREA